jgi:hypothetical protein
VGFLFSLTIATRWLGYREMKTGKPSFTFEDAGGPTGKSTATNIQRKAFKKEVESRYPLPEHGSKTTKFYTVNQTLFAVGYNRVVYGNRGPYVEFEASQVKVELDHRFPENELPDEAYYEWLTVNDASQIKVYNQRRRVSYADYRPGKLYVSPFELIVK